jgi:hypothetical protein
VGKLAHKFAILIVGDSLAVEGARDVNPLVLPPVAPRL